MNESNGAKHEVWNEVRLPRRDWLLLPLIGVSTIILLSVCTELAARHMFSERLSLMSHCLMSDLTTGGRGIPNTVCWEKSPESASAIEYRFNSCGHRAGVECGPKAPGTYRIVMVGSSIAMGDRVPWDKTFAVLLPKELSRRTGREIELYNEGVMISYPHIVARNISETLAAKPDMILWILTPFDIETETSETYMPNPAGNAGVLVRGWARIKVTLAGMSLPDSMSYLWQRALGPFEASRTATMIKHFLYLDEGRYVKSCLLGGDPMGYLLAHPSLAWTHRLTMLRTDFDAVQRQAKDAGVPLLTVLIPTRPQVRVVS
jgi:hypothetical protein